MAANYNYRNFEAELKQVKEYLTKNNATSTMCAFALGIYRPNLTRHKRTLEEAGLLVVTHNATCKATGWKADYLSCDPAIVARVKGGNGGK